MLATLIALGFVASTQQPADTHKPELAVISARLGTCTADFTVSGADGKPVYAATVHVRIRYGFLGLKRMDLEVGTNSDGKARVEGLPARARPLVYEVWKGNSKTTVAQDLATNCQAMYQVSLK